MIGALAANGALSFAPAGILNSPAVLTSSETPASSFWNQQKFFLVKVLGILQNVVLWALSETFQLCYRVFLSLKLAKPIKYDKVSM